MFDKMTMKTILYMGEGSLDRLKELTNQSIFLVVDPFLEKAGLLPLITDRLQAGNNTYQIFSNIIPDPTIETVAEGMKIMKEVKPDLIVIVGGGSAIDAGKAMKFLAMEGFDYPAIPIIAVPTTSGTGSEVTSFSVITDDAKGVKYPIVNDLMIPEEAILDPQLVITVPPAVTADTGMDVLTHAMEAYVSTKANPVSDALAEKAVQLVFHYLERAYRDGKDMEAREKMHIASCMAGLAFNQASLGLNHALAHVCGAKFHIPHGRMNTLLLTTVMEFNSQGNENLRTGEKYASLAKVLGLPVTTLRIGVRNLGQEIKKLQKRLHMPMTLTACGVDRETLHSLKEEIAQAALEDGCMETNPRQPTEQELVDLLMRI